jgi:histidinol-phosphate/aromatic aminotransferase/cobyric acid decarboxylase-like protein
VTQLRLHGDTAARAGMLDFAVNVWPAARPPALQRALEAALSDERYPREAAPREAVAAKHGRRPAEVLLANGACECFWLLAHALRPRLAACVHPGFTEPEAALRAVGAEVVSVFRGDAVPEDVELVVLGNPNNPTGELETREAILGLTRPGRLVVVDEAFMDFVPGEAESLAAQRGVVVVRSLTKLWSLAGIRAGYLLGDPELVERLTSQRQPWSVNALACAALEVCAADTETPARVAAEVAAARAELVEGLSRLQLRVRPSVANFLLLELEDGPGLVDALAARGIAVRRADSFPGLDERHVRVAVRRPHENARLLRALEEALG